MAVGAFAGLVDGFARGVDTSRRWAREDEDAKAREEERAYLREQRDRLRREQQADDEIDRRLSGVPTTAEKWGTDYSGAAARGASMRDDEGNLMPGVQSAPRSYRDVAADQAAAVRGIGGRRGVAMANQLQQFVNAEKDREEAGIDRTRARQLGDIQLRQAQALESWKQAGQLYATGNLVGSLKTLGAGYKNYPDGRELVVTDDGRFGLATPDGKWVSEPVPVNRENVEAALTHAQRFLDPSAWANFQQVRQGDTKITDDRNYRTGQQGIDRDRLALSREEFAAKLRGGMFQRPPTAADIFNPIGVSDDGTRMLGRQGGNIREVAIPEGYDKGLFPRVTGNKGPRPTRFLKSGEDGTHTAYGDDGKPLFNLLPNGVEAPLGVTGDSWRKQEQLASKAGVRAAIGKGPDGSPMVAYIGRDGQPYSTLEEAAAAKPAKK